MKDKDIKNALDAQALVDRYGSIKNAAKKSGIPRQTLHGRLKNYNTACELSYKELPPDDIPTDEIINTTFHPLYHRLCR